MTSNKVLCMYCNLRREQGKEDVIPHWIAREVGGTAPFFSDMWSHQSSSAVSISKTRTVGSAASMKAPDVCKICNGGWMSRLETRAIPILLPMIRGERSALNRVAQKTVALWAVQHALTYDQYIRNIHGQSDLIPREYGTHILYHAKTTPIPFSSVRLGSYSPTMKGLEHPHGRRQLWFREEPYNVPVGQFVEITFVFKRLIVQISLYSGNRIHPGFEFVTSLNDPYFVGCWPFQTDQIALPTRLSLNLVTLTRLITGESFGQLPRPPWWERQPKSTDPNATPSGS